MFSFHFHLLFFSSHIRVVLRAIHRLKKANGRNEVKLEGKTDPELNRSSIFSTATTSCQVRWPRPIRIQNEFYIKARMFSLIKKKHTPFLRRKEKLNYFLILNPKSNFFLITRVFIFSHFRLFFLIPSYYF